MSMYSDSTASFNGGKKGKGSGIQVSSLNHATKDIAKDPVLIPSKTALQTTMGTVLPLIIEPAQVVFEDISPEIRYVMTIAVRNNTTTAQRIRFSTPKSSFYSINYIPSGAVAPGIDIRAEIEFQIANDSPGFLFPDSIIVSMGPHKVEVPLIARKPCSNIIFDPFLNVGILSESQIVRHDVIFENVGEVSGTVSLRLGTECVCLTLDPSSITIPAKAKGKISIQCVGKSLGPIRELIQVNISGIPNHMILDVNGQVIVQKISLVPAEGGGHNSLGLMDHVDFGTLFYGMSKVIKAFLVNSGPQPVNFNVQFPDELDMSHMSQGGDVSTPGLLDVPSRSILISPMDGVIPAFGQIPVSISFKPLLPKFEKGFYAKFLAEYSEPQPLGAKACFDVMDENQNVFLETTAFGVLPTYKISNTILRFGTCPLNDRRDILITFTNMSPIDLSFDFNEKEVAQCKMTPSSGVVKPKEAITIVASYIPAQLGAMKKVMVLSVEKGLKSTEFRFSGDCVPSTLKKSLVGGTDKLPEDFKPSYKFVDPKEVQLSKTSSGAKTLTKKSKPWESLEFNYTNSWDEVYDSKNNLSQAPPMAQSNDKLTYSIQELQKRSDHVQGYNTFLQESHTKRQEKHTKMMKKILTRRGLPDRSDPNGVDMGMERGLDDDPRLKIPKANEPLYMMNRSDDGDRAGHKFQFDEDRLITKKAKDSPSNQAEMRDCASELTSEDLKSIVPSHKVINFGKISVNSVNLKNFVVTNELSQMVIVRLGTLEPELRQSKPMCQVLASNSMVGFDISLTCREPGKYKRTITYNINDSQHKLNIIAEVVPIEIILDRKQITMEFAADSMEKLHREKLIMSNPGNAVAEYLWGNQGPFQVMPQQGTINPGQSFTATVVWTPNANTPSNAESIGLHVQGGVEQSLALTGILPDAKIAFDEKKISIGVTAVGFERKYLFHVRNTSEYGAVFHVDEINPNLYLSVKPEFGRINPNEVTELELTVNPQGPVNYENKVICVSLRGGKSIALKLSGEAIVPQITIMQESFDFGSVVSGACQRLPITLHNTGNIAADATLDLNLFSEFRISVNSNALSEGNDSSSGNELSEDEIGNSIEYVRHGVDHPIYRIVVLPQCKLNAYLMFAPKKAKNFNFKLPMFLTGMNNGKSLQRPVQATALTSRLSVSNFVVDFGDRVVALDEMARISYFKEITFKNIDTSGLSYEIVETSKGEGAVPAKNVGGEISPIFFVSPIKSDLAPGETNTVRVTFSPKSNGDYTTTLHVFLSGQEDASRPYFTILCTGSGVYPRLNFSKQSIIMPIVPLQIASRASCVVYNMGYDNIELKYRVSPTIPVPLEITFPDGSELGLTKDRATIIISAIAEQPVSWIGKIEFYDTEGNKFFIDVCGCSDSSILTTNPFLSCYGDKYGYIGLDGFPVRYCMKRDIATLKAQEMKAKTQLRKLRSMEMLGNSSTADLGLAKKESKRQLEILNEATNRGKGAEDEGIDIVRTQSMLAEACDGYYEKNDIQILLRWLNTFINRKEIDTKDYPKCILETNGDLVIDCIEQLCGKKVMSALLSSIPRASHVEEEKSNSEGGGVGNKGNSIASRAQFVNRTIAKYRALIGYLAKLGALVIHINPVSLLDIESYLMTMSTEFKRNEGNKLTQASLKSRRMEWEADWERNCISGWNQILFQSFKIFVLARVTYKEYINTPGIFITPTAESEPREDGAKKDDKGKEKKKRPEDKNKAPPELTASNVFSSSESVVLAWASYHQQTASRMADTAPALLPSNPRMPTLNRRIIDLGSEFSDFYAFCQLIHAHIPSSTQPGNVLSGYTFTEMTEKLENFERFKNALRALKIDFDIAVNELESSPRAMLILLTHLFLNLPNFVPKTTIEFKGTLGKCITKTIELANPSKKSVSYNVTVEGPPDFSLEANVVTLLPQSKLDFKIFCTPRFSKPATGQVTFWGVREAGVGGMTMLFDLVSRVDDRNAVSVTRHTSTLFDLQHIEIMITNPFDRECLCPITLIQHHTTQNIEDLLSISKLSNVVTKKSANSMQSTNQALAALLSEVNSTSVSASVGNNPKIEEEDAKRLFQDPFWCTEPSITLGPRETKKLVVHALPFMLGQYHCSVVLIDNNVGEFGYEINLQVNLPQAIDDLSMDTLQLENGDAIQQVVRVASSNTIFEKAVQQATDSRLTLNRRAKAKVFLSNLLASPISDEETGQSNFFVHFNSSHFNCSKEFGMVVNSPVVSSSNAAGSGAGASAAKKFPKVAKCGLESYNPSSILANSIPFSFFPEKAGVYKTRITVYSLGNAYDIRVINIVVNVKPAEKKLTLLFNGACRQKIVQDIPVKNESETNWSLVAMIAGRGYSAPKTIDVPKGQTVTFPVTFCGLLPGEFDGTLTLKNPNSYYDTFDFKLKGSAGEPLAEDHLDFKCKARSKEEFLIPIPTNLAISGTKTFTIETDLTYMSGASEIVLDSGQHVKAYPFQVLCPIGGVISGSITFKDKASTQMFWYTVDIEVTSPMAESMIELETEVRKAVAVEITLDNPTNEELEFNVIIQGSGLLGNNTFTLPPSSSNSKTYSAVYELIYSPLSAGRTTGSISFSNSKVGEFWYNVYLNALPAEPIQVDRIECMAGTMVKTHLPVENPLSETVQLKVTSSDPQHFILSSETITLGPYAQTNFEVLFNPSNLVEVFEAEIILSNESFGDIVYHLTGKGLLPGVMPQVHIMAPVNEIGSYTITFRNPFDHHLPLDIVLDERRISNKEKPEDGADMDDAPSIFGLLLRKPSGVVLAPFASLQVPISFSPIRFGDYNATISFRSSVMGKNLLWCYPINGIAEAGVPHRLPTVSTACKSSYLSEVDIDLHGLLKADLQPEETLSQNDFTVEVVVPDAQYRSVVTRTFRVQTLELVEVVHPSSEEGQQVQVQVHHRSSDYKMRYRILFEPLKVFTTMVELVIVCKNKGRWRCFVELEVLDPLPDDTILLTAPVGSQDRVSFKLTNRFLGYSNFEAYFSPQSSPHFSVTPSAGVLAPFGSAEGTQFVVTFAPKEYGTRERANLTVATEDAQWNYEILGSYPDLNINFSQVKSKVNSNRNPHK